jgi:hypothetical protein
VGNYLSGFEATPERRSRLPAGTSDSFFLELNTVMEKEYVIEI